MSWTVDILVLGDVPAAAWERFHEDEGEPQRLGELAAHWTRSRALGAPPRGARPEEGLMRGDDLRSRSDRLEPVGAIGGAAVDRLRALLDARDYTLIIAAADGVLVKALGGGAFLDHARRVRLIEGASWSEAERGTNAIGTALHEQRPVVVRGHAHYGRSYQGLVCYAAPLRDADGSLLGVVDATSFVERADDDVGRGVVAAAAAIEAALRQRAYAQAGSALQRALARALDRVDVPAVLVEAPGQLVRGNAAARALGLGRDAALLDWPALRAEALAPTPGGRLVELWDSRAGRAVTFALQVEPIESRDGALLAAILFFEPLRAMPALPARAGTAGVRQRAADPFAAIFAEDDAMRSAVALARRVAASELSVILLAETGAGKELFARAIHEASAGSAGPFVAVNCGAVAPQLLESELFGHAPGAFTGAAPKGRAGLVQAAAGGTLFLDEIAEMSLAMQAVLLRFLETGEYHRVGSSRAERASVRVVCATCRDLPARVAAGEFRDDLYYRLRGVIIQLPPLRERADLVPLAEHLLACLAEREGVPPPRLSDALVARLRSHPWPGNVRELRTALQLALVLGRGHDPLESDHLPPELWQGTSGPARPAAAALAGPLAEVEGHAVRRVLAEVGGNVSAAARRLGVARSTLYRMMRRHGVTGTDDPATHRGAR